jgi:hypothetical protein
LSVNDENKFDGDPHYYFHEFQLFLARLAMETIGKGSDKKGINNKDTSNK